MSLVRIIPRLDIKGPNVVKGLCFEGYRVLGHPETFAQTYYEAGADDYITKPVKPKVLVSKIKAILRRSSILKDKVEVLEFEDLMIYPEEYKIQILGKFKILPRKEFELLYLLASKPEKIFRRDQIMDLVWGDHVVVGDRTIDVHVRKLREKLVNRFIGTQKGVGYKFFK